MKNFKLLPLVLLVSTPAFANVDPKIAEFCLKATDYKGCVEAHSSQTKGKADTPTESDCESWDETGVCIIEKCKQYNKYGVCIDGKNHVFYKENADDVELRHGFTFRRSSVQQLKIRGSYGRYLTFWGRSVNDFQGTAGTYNPGYAGSLNCTSTGYGYGYGTTNCVRTGYVAPSYIPGTPGGTQARWFEYELDCVDRTYNRKGDIASGAYKKGWMDVYYDPTASAVADKYCDEIEFLPKKY